MKVGPDGEDCWTIQKDLLSSQSIFFRVALSGEWYEAKAKTIELPKEGPAVFEIFVQWLFTGETGINDHKHVTDRIAQNVAKAWIIGDKFECPLFKGLLMDNLITMFREELVLDRYFIDCAFSGAVVDSQLCRFTVIQFIMDSMINDPANTEDPEEWDSTFPSTMAFGIELARLMPTVHQYLHRWYCNTPIFSHTDATLYKARLKLLIERRSTFKEIEELDD